MPTVSIRGTLKKPIYEENPLDDGTLEEYYIIRAPATSLTKEALKDLGLDTAAQVRSKNMFALGMVTFIFQSAVESTGEVH